MEYTTLGSTGLYVSKLCFGAMTFGAPVTEQKEADDLIAMAGDVGVNFVDTSNVYNAGLSERMLGKAIKSKRDEWIVSTKVFFSTEAEKHRSLSSSRQGILKSVDASLARLQTDYIDLYYLHSFDHYTPLEETLRTLDDLVRMGKVRHIGVSNFCAWHITKAVYIARELNLEPISATQSHYALTCRDLEYEIIPSAQDANVGVVVWSPLAGGFLTGKYKRDGGGEGRRQTFALPPVDSRFGYDIIDTVTEIAARHDTSCANVSLAWLLSQTAVSSVVLGFTRSAQLAENLRSLEVALTNEDLLALQKVSEPGLMYPQWSWFSDKGEYSAEGMARFYGAMAANKRNSILGMEG